MKRTTIFLAQVQIDGLAKAAKRTGLCSAQIIRISLNEYFARQAQAQRESRQRP